MSPVIARFHAETGPEPLFVRVRQVLSSVRELRLHGGHLAERTVGTDAPLADLRAFDPAAWDLILVEARQDTGKFVSTTWRRRYPNGEWWVVIGFGDTVRTLYQASGNKRALGAGIVTAGPLWDLVYQVNTSLVEAHSA
ncbi:hypothetical protein [Catellatospora sp. NPDC049133]|jgi:hypothetical protein|uniref:hypothetical protein n=1 Tax=Catellatospora sp. NPDC049133 TaxID=3155499 RepID=UPI0033FBF76E